MFTKKTHHPAAIVPTTVVLSAFAPSQESYLAELPTRFPGVEVIAGAALESQQLDHSAQQAALDKVIDTLDKYDEDHPHTGPMHIYLLDGQGLAGGDPQGEGTLRALVNSAMNQPYRTVAALMPEDRTITKAEELAPSTLLRQLADSVLSTEGVTILVGAAALEAFLVNPPVRSIEGTASIEGVGSAVALTTIFGGMIIAVAALIHYLGKGIEKLINAPRGGDESKKDVPVNHIATMCNAIEATYLSPGWLATKKMVVGVISGQGIVDRLHDGRALPTDIAKAASGHLKAANRLCNGFSQLYTPYAKKVNSTLEQMVAMFKKDGNAAAAIAYGEKTLKGIREPGSFFRGYSLVGFLGNPKFDHDHDANSLEFTDPTADIKVTALSAADVPKVAAALLGILREVPVLAGSSSPDPRIHDYEDDILSAADTNDLWQAMIGNDVANPYDHHYRLYHWNDVLHSTYESTLMVAKALELLLARSIQK